MSKDNADGEVLGCGKWLRLRKVGKWEWVQRVNTTGVAGIYAFTDDDEVVLVEQPRPPLGNARVLEIPAGLVGDIVGQEDEAVDLAAKRELIEETGYEAGELREVVEVPSAPGITEETISLYVARGLTKVGPGGGDESEDIEVILVPMSEFQEFIEGRIRQGTLIDPKVFAVPVFYNL
ncbi:MAG: NUDIX hydrolase [Myxococcales bacterium]|nr:NUDIX hydrolase [Myxococcales bacterium]